MFLNTVVIIVSALIGGTFFLYALWEWLFKPLIKRYDWIDLNEEDEEEIIKKHAEEKVNYEKEKKRQIIRQQLMSRNYDGDDLSNYRINAHTEIKGFAKPIGRWTRLIIGERMNQMRYMKHNNKNVRGLWQLIASMGSQTLGRYKGRSR